MQNRYAKLWSARLLMSCLRWQIVSGGLTREQTEKYIAQMGMRELTDEKLEQVAGGLLIDYIKVGDCKNI